MIDLFTGPQQPVTVLLVDDQPIIGESIRLSLEPESDIVFHFVSDPHRALAVAIEVSPTVILQDLVMPDLDGLELVRRFREDERTRHVPLIVLSTREDPAVKAEAFRLLANDYLVKLPSDVELVARIRYHSQAYLNACRFRQAFEEVLESRELLRQRSEEILRQRDDLARQAQELSLRNRFIKKTFGRYLSDDVVAALLASPEGLKLGGESRVVTILMSDLRGFTAVADRLAPEQVVRVLNNFLGTMADVITEYRGTIDEFIGDAILAIFGAPVQGDDDAARGVACAIAMQRAMLEVNEWNRGQGLPEIEMGIAVNTGEVVVGNIGSQTRAKYGIVGSHVNLAARIESCSVGGQVLISETTLLAASPGVEVGERIQVNAKGFARPISAHVVKGMQGRFALAVPDTSLGRTVTVSPALPVHFSVLDEKQLGDERFEGHLVTLSAKGGEVRSSRATRALTNVVLRLVDADGTERPGDIYGKVLATVRPGVFSVHFTSVPPEVTAIFRALLDAA